MTVLVVAVVRKRLALLDDAARDRLKAAMLPGARHVSGLQDKDGTLVEIGAATRTKPVRSGPSWRITDPAAFLAWVEVCRPQEVLRPEPVPVAPSVRPAYVTAVLAGAAGKLAHEPWCDPATGEAIEVPPGVELVPGGPGVASTLMVKVAEPDGERMLLDALRSGAIALPAVLDELSAVEA